MKYQSTKVIELGSCAFRQPFATSKCSKIHGYRLVAKFWFDASLLDQNNWVVDFGALKDLKTQLEAQFDHTTVLWSKDPQLELFKELNNRGAIDLRVMEDGVGIEKFAEFCLELADKYVRSLTNNRCWVSKVEVWEHEKNSGTAERTSSLLTSPSWIYTPLSTGCGLSAGSFSAGSFSFSGSTNVASNNVGPENTHLLLNETVSELPVTPDPAPVVPATTPTPAPVQAQPARRQPIPAPVGNVIDKENNLSFKKALDGLQWGKKQK